MRGEPYTPPNWKNPKGTATLERKGRRADVVAHEDAEMLAAKKRDGFKCRYPGCSGKFRGQTLAIHAAHMLQPDGITKHRGAGGDPSMVRTQKRYIVSLCSTHHGLYDVPNSGIDIEPVSDLGADGLLAFYRYDKETGERLHVATETHIGVSVTVGD